jgi:hypothetical protein
MNQLTSTIKENTKWTSTSGEVFTVNALYSPNEENDPWVHYTNEAGDPFSCRAEAFTSRFSPLVD